MENETLQIISTVVFAFDGIAVSALVVQMVRMRKGLDVNFKKIDLMVERIDNLSSVMSIQKQEKEEIKTEPIKPKGLIDGVKGWFRI